MCPRWLAVVFLLIFFTIASSPMAMDLETEAVQMVENLGGTVTRDETAKGKPVCGLDLANTRVTNADLKHFAVFKHLQTLNLGGVRQGDRCGLEAPGQSSPSSRTRPSRMPQRDG